MLPLLTLLQQLEPLVSETRALGGGASSGDALRVFEDRGRGTCSTGVGEGGGRGAVIEVMMSVVGGVRGPGAVTGVIIPDVVGGLGRAAGAECAATGVIWSAGNSIGAFSWMKKSGAGSSAGWAWCESCVFTVV